MRCKQMRPKLGGGAYADFTSANQFSCKVEHIKCKQQQVKEKKRQITTFRIRLWTSAEQFDFIKIYSP